MKKILFVVFAATTLCNHVMAQDIELGLRDNQYAHVDYVDRRGWLVGYEQSLLNVKLKTQNGRLFAGYQLSGKGWLASAVAYGGGEFSGNWKAYGADFRGVYTWKCMELGLTLNPNYDTGLDFQFNYNAMAAISVYRKEKESQSVKLTVSYGNIPEFRDNVNNFRFGMQFINGDLWVKPELSVPKFAEDSDNTYIRVLCSFGWKFHL